jgi:hypothetical protein
VSANTPFASGITATAYIFTIKKERRAEVEKKEGRGEGEREREIHTHISPISSHLLTILFLDH